MLVKIINVVQVDMWIEEHVQKEQLNPRINTPLSILGKLPPVSGKMKGIEKPETLL